MNRNLLFAAILFFTEGFAQQPQTHRITDAFGNELSQQQLSKANTASGRKANSVSNAGFFELTFKTGSGFEGTDSVGIARQNVAIQVFSDISALIQPAKDPYTNASTLNTPLVKIAFEPWSIVAAPPAGEKAIGSTYYVYPVGANGGITDGEIWKTINGGYDSYKNMSLLGYNQLYFHGYIAVDFSSSFYANLKALNLDPAQYDLYTVLLHSAIHSLGFNSLINSLGQSVLGTGKYSRYDSYLLNSTSSLLIDNTDNCYATTFSGTSLTPAPGCQNNIQFGITSPQPVYGPSTFVDEVSLSHFDFNCTFLNYVMSPGLPTGPSGNRRKPLVPEVKALCDIGYKITGTYGTQKLVSEPAVNNTYSFDNTYGPCGNRIGGVNDYFIGGDPLTPYSVPLGQQIIISDFLNNDESDDLLPTKAECVRLVSGLGTVNSTNTTITYQAPTSYPPNFGGQVYISYIPVNSSGKRGNIAYIAIHLTDVGPACVDTTCNLVCHGNFEAISDPNALAFSNVILSGFSAPGSPDLYVNNCRYGLDCGNSASLQGFGCSSSPIANPQPHGGDRYIGMFPGEPVFFEMREDMMPGKTYQVSYWALTTSNDCSPFIKTYISAAAPCQYPYTVDLAGSSSCGSYTFSPTLIRSEKTDNLVWKSFSFSYTVPASSAPAKYLIISADDSNPNAYVMIDDITIYRTPIIVDAGADTYPCSNHIATFKAKSCVPGTYSYSWQQAGAGVIGTTDTITVNPSVTTSYIVTMTNLNSGLVGSDTVVVFIDQYLAFDISVKRTCLGDSSGSITIDSIPNGKAPFTFYWSSTPPTSSATFSGLKAGEYFVKVVDSLNCAGKTMIKVDNFVVPEIGLKYLKPVTCFGGSDGRLKLSVTTGDGPFRYQWDLSPSQKGDSLLNVKVGNYTVSVTDSNNCVTPKTFTIENLPLTQLSLSSEDVTCPNGIDGKAKAIPSNSKKPYTLKWSNYPPSTDTVAANLVAGTYSVTVTDGNSCKTVAKVEVKEESPTPPCCGMNVSKQEIMAYPNPSSGVFNFCFNSDLRSHLLLKTSEFNVYDLKGNLVFHDARSTRILSDYIDLSGLMPGLYILEVATDQKVVRRKLFLY